MPVKTYICHCAYKVETSESGGGEETKIYVKVMILERLAFFSVSEVSINIFPRVDQDSALFCPLVYSYSVEYFIMPNSCNTECSTNYLGLT